MDERKAELKRLKKQARKARGRYTAPWKCFCLVCLVLALLLGAVWGRLYFADRVNTPTVLAETLQTGKTAVLSGWNMLIRSVSPAYQGTVIFPERQIFLIAAGGFALFLLCLIPWGVGKCRWKKSEEYLNYRTMKNVLYAEKRER